MRLAKMSGRACVPISSWSLNPRVMTSSVGSPLRSSSALVATVVPIFTAAMRSDGIAAPEGDAEEQPDGLQRRVVVGAGVVRQQLAGEDAAVGCACNDVGEGAAAVDPEVPLVVARLPGHPDPLEDFRRSRQLSGVAHRRQPRGHVAAAPRQISGICGNFTEQFRNLRSGLFMSPTNADKGLPCHGMQ